MSNWTILFFIEKILGIQLDARKEMERMEQALAYVCCSAEESRVKVQKYCRKIYELGYVPICPRFVFSPFLEESDAEDMQGYGRMSHILLRRCRMVVVCGKEVTGNKDTEISMATDSISFVRHLMDWYR